MQVLLRSENTAALPTTCTLTTSFPGSSERIKQIPAIYRATLSYYLIGKDSGVLSPFPCSCGSKDVVREEENKNVGMLSTCLGYYSCLVQRIPRTARTRTNTASTFHAGFKQLRLSSNRTTDSMLAMSPASPLSAGDGIATDCAETVVSSPAYDGTFHSWPVSGRPPTLELRMEYATVHCDC